jgi:hypothetical protein
VSALAEPTLELLPLPAGKLPVIAVRSAVDRYRAGGSSEALTRCVDLYGDELEHELHRRLSEQAAEFERLVRELERQHSYMATTHAQLTWLRRFPAGTVGDRASPIGCRLPSGAVIAAPRLLGALHKLELDERLLANGNGDRRRRSGHDRRGSSPAMQLLADAGLSTRILATEMDVSKTAPLSWLHGRYRAPPELEQAIARLTGDPELASEIVALIPSRNGAGHALSGRPRAAPSGGRFRAWRAPTGRRPRRG